MQSSAQRCIGCYRTCTQFSSDSDVRCLDFQHFEEHLLVSGCAGVEITGLGMGRCGRNALLPDMKLLLRSELLGLGYRRNRCLSSHQSSPCAYHWYQIQTKAPPPLKVTVSSGLGWTLTTWCKKHQLVLQQHELNGKLQESGIICRSLLFRIKVMLVTTYHILRHSMESYEFATDASIGFYLHVTDSFGPHRKLCSISCAKTHEALATSAAIFWGFGANSSGARS
eukprot:3444480-Amphidinium_carterae.2